MFVAVSIDGPQRILGYFTLSAATVVPADEKRLPRHAIPAALVGRLAVEASVARRGLGGLLLADAVKKAAVAAETVAMAVMVVDPIDERAEAFYAAFGFECLNGPRRRMFLALPFSRGGADSFA